MIAFAVLALSALLLSYEILLVRAFAIRFFHHFAAMAIGIAMLGFGASGTWLALRPPRTSSAIPRRLAWITILTPLLLLVCPLLAGVVPLDPTQLPTNPAEWPRLFLVVLLLAIPFFVGALGILLGVAAAGARPGLVYGASFLGAALGVGVAVLAGFHAPPWAHDISPYKELPQVEAFPGARRIAEAHSPIGWVVATEAPAFRYAPGLSLTHGEGFPKQTALFVDGQLAGAVNRWGSPGEAEAFVRNLPASLPYALLRRTRVAVVGAGGGADVWAGLVGGAGDIAGVELHPDLVRLTRPSLDSAAVAKGARIRWVIGDARGFIARTTDRFDLITLGIGGALGSAVGGLHALNEDFLHTKEAYSGYLRRLSEGGVLSVTRWLTMPPRGEVRMVLTAVDALREVAPSSLARGLVVAHGWATATVLVKPSGFTRDEIAALEAEARTRRIDLDWYPGMTEEGEPPVHVLEGDPLRRATEAAIQAPSSGARFAERHAFDIAPSTDARPYPHHFLRAGTLVKLLRSDQGSWLPFAEWGTLTLLATVVPAIVLGSLLLVLAAGAGGPPESGWRLFVYFGAIGLGFMAAEIAAIQQAGLLLGHPVYAVATSLAAILAFSGLGSAWSDRIPARMGGRGLAALALWLAVQAGLLLGVIHAAMPAPFPIRVGIAIVTLAPMAFLMGWGFPLGLRRFTGERSAARGWAWAVNGFASVAAAPLSGLIALEAGSRALLAFGAIAYAIAWMVFQGRDRTSPIRQPVLPWDAGL